MRIGAAPCPCGRPFALLTGIQGRTEDTLHLPGVAGGMVAIHPHLFHSVLDTVPAGGWRVVQEAAGRLRILVSQAAADLDDAGLTATLGRALAAQGAAVADLIVERVAAIPKGAAGKAPLIVAYRPAAPAPAAPPADRVP